MEVIVRQANSSDFEIVAQLGRETFYETWRSVNTEEDLQVYLVEAFEPLRVQGELNDTVTNRFLVAEIDGKAIGYLKYRFGSDHADFTDQMAAEIERLYIFRTFHGKGVAQLIMDTALNNLRNEGYQWVYLGVDVNNHRAIRLYEKYGFIKFDVKPFRIGNAVDTDQLMKRPL